MYNALFSVIFLLFNSPSDVETLNSEQKIIQVTQDHLQEFLSKIPQGQEPSFGFSNREEFASSTVGKPIAVITVTKDFYNDKELQAKDYILKGREWRVPILLNGESKVLFTVVKKGENFEVVDIGGAMLAKELQQLETNSSENDHYLFRLYPLAMDFLVRVPEGSSLENGKYLPLSSAEKALNMTAKVEFTQAEVLQLLKKHHSENFKTKP